MTKAEKAKAAYPGWDHSLPKSVLEAESRRRQFERRVLVWMDKVDWDHEVGAAMGGNKVFPSRWDLEANRKCVEECGIVQVEMRLKRIVRRSVFRRPAKMTKRKT